MTSIIMSREEIDKIMDTLNVLIEEDRMDEYFELSKKIPLAPHLAMAYKDIHGSEYLKNSDFNLSEAEAKFGKDWLDR